MTIKEALRLIVKDQECPALNWAVNYAKAALLMPEDSELFWRQMLYVSGNISHWRAGKTSKCTKEQIKEVRQTIRQFIKEHKLA